MWLEAVSNWRSAAAYQCPAAMIDGTASCPTSGTACSPGAVCSAWQVPVSAAQSQSCGGAGAVVAAAQLLSESGTCLHQLFNRQEAAMVPQQCCVPITYAANVDC